MQPHRAVAAGDGQADRRAPCRARRCPRRVVERSTLTRRRRRQLEPGAGKRRQAADVVVHLAAGLRPIDARLVLVDLGRVGDARRPAAA